MVETKPTNNHLLKYPAKYIMFSVQEYNLLLYLLLLWQFQFVYPLRQSSQYILLSPAFQEVLESLLFRCFFLHRQADLLQDRIRLRMGEQRKADLVLQKEFQEPV